MCAGRCLAGLAGVGSRPVDGHASRSLDNLIPPAAAGTAGLSSEGLRGLEVDDELELRRLLDRRSTGFAPFRTLSDVGGCTTNRSLKSGPYEIKPARLDQSTELVITGSRCLIPSSAMRRPVHDRARTFTSMTAPAPAFFAVVKAPSKSAFVASSVKLQFQGPRAAGGRSPVGVSESHKIAT